MSTPVIGYLDPQLLACLNEIRLMLKDLFQTKNRLTLALPATGGGGMEASFFNFVEPGYTVVIGVKGFFGDRMTEVASRCGAKVIRVDREWG
jgi:alanine-glyoxylate transaminase/serine-glyoxylate transaminase/serine-pyruvate transaminase